MPNLLAMSFEGELAPSFELRCLHPGRTLPDGWGLGYYPGGEPSAAILKEPAPPQGSIRSQLVKAWEHLESSLFVLHIRTATWGALTDANTQPFSRTWGRRDWLIAHAGSLDRSPVAEGATALRAGRLDRHRADVLRAAQPVRRARLAQPRRRRRSSRGAARWFDELNELGEPDDRASPTAATCSSTPIAAACRCGSASSRRRTRRSRSATTTSMSISRGAARRAARA